MKYFFASLFVSSSLLSLSAISAPNPEDPIEEFPAAAMRAQPDLDCAEPDVGQVAAFAVVKHEKEQNIRKIVIGEQFISLEIPEYKIVLSTPTDTVVARHIRDSGDEADAADKVVVASQGSSKKEDDVVDKSISLLSLPLDVLKHIATQLSLQELRSFRLVSRYLREAADSVCYVYPPDFHDLSSPSLKFFMNFKVHEQDLLPSVFELPAGKRLAGTFPPVVVDILPLDPDGNIRWILKNFPDLTLTFALISPGEAEGEEGAIASAEVLSGEAEERSPLLDHPQITTQSVDDKFLQELWDQELARPNAILKEKVDGNTIEDMKNMRDTLAPCLINPRSRQALYRVLKRCEEELDFRNILYHFAKVPAVERSGVIGFFTPEVLDTLSNDTFTLSLSVAIDELVKLPPAQRPSLKTFLTPEILQKCDPNNMPYCDIACLIGSLTKVPAAERLGIMSFFTPEILEKCKNGTEVSKLIYELAKVPAVELPALSAFFTPEALQQCNNFEWIKQQILRIHEEHNI